MKLSFCLGFAIDQDTGVVKRNSCANELSCGQREMTDEYYDQLVALLVKQGYDAVADNAVDGDDDDDGLAGMLGSMALGGGRKK